MKSFTDLTTGERLRLARQRAGWTAKSVAAVLGVDAVTVSRFESDDSRVPRGAYMIAFAHMYDTPLFELYHPDDLPDDMVEGIMRHAGAS